MTPDSTHPSLRFRLIACGLSLLTLILLIEYTVSALYMPGRSLYPSFDTVMADFHYDIFVDDSELIRRLKPDCTKTHPKTMKAFTTNSQGYRGEEFNGNHGSDSLKVVFLGDSLLFGMGISEEDTIPSCLRKALAGSPGVATGRDIEVFNLSVPGYTSFQGRKQAETLLAELHPDLVVVGFGYTDGMLVNFTEAEVQATIAQSQSWLTRYDSLLSWSHLYHLMKNMMRSKEAKEALGRITFTRNGGDHKITARVPPEEFRANMNGIIAAAREAGAECVLLDPNLSNFYAHEMLETLAADAGVPFCSARKTLERLSPRWEFKLADTKRKRRVMAIQVRGLSVNNRKEHHQPLLIRVPKGQLRYPPDNPEERAHFVDNGEIVDLEAGDGVYTAFIVDDGDRGYEFSPTVKILLQQELTYQNFLNSDIFYKLPNPDHLKKRGLYYSPVIDFRKPLFHEYVLHSNTTLPNGKGAQAIAQALATSVVEALKTK